MSGGNVVSISAFLNNPYDGVGVQVDDAVVVRERVREELHELRRAAAAALCHPLPCHLFSRFLCKGTDTGEPDLVNNGRQEDAFTIN